MGRGTPSGDNEGRHGPSAAAGRLHGRFASHALPQVTSAGQGGRRSRGFSPCRAYAASITVEGMRTSASPASMVPSGELWFQQRPRLALAVIAALFATVFALRLSAGTPVDAYSMLYILPVALAATAFGQRGGVSGGLVALLLIVVWTLARDVTLSPSNWATRVVPILLLGILLGGATDRARRAEAERRRLEHAALLHRQAIEINDSLIQQMSAAKWSFEAGQTDAGLEALTVAVHDAQELVSALIRRADMSNRSEPVPPPTAPHSQQPDIASKSRTGGPRRTA